MGVKDLWRLLETAGRPVSLESLDGVVLAVDVSIWLHQAVKGVRDKGGGAVSHAHLLVLFSRICKLLHYRIKPVFVFDGATPLLKERTLAARGQRREQASQKSLTAADKQVTKFLQAKILEQITGEKSTVLAPVSSTQPDMFELPPLPETPLNKERSPSFPKSPSPAQGEGSLAYLGDVAAMDIHSQEFDSLPPEVQHELLMERQQVEKYSYSDPASLPQVADEFSSYQLSRLVRRSHVSQKLEGVRRSLKSNETAVVGLGEEAKIHEVESSRIVSSDSARYILVHGTDIGSLSQDETLSQDSMEFSETGEQEFDRLHRIQGEAREEPKLGDNVVESESRDPSVDTAKTNVRFSQAKEIAADEGNRHVVAPGRAVSLSTLVTEVRRSGGAETTGSTSSSALEVDATSSSLETASSAPGEAMEGVERRTGSTAEVPEDAGEGSSAGAWLGSGADAVKSSALSPASQLPGEEGRGGQVPTTELEEMSPRDVAVTSFESKRTQLTLVHEENTLADVSEGMSGAVRSEGEEMSGAVRSEGEGMSGAVRSEGEGMRGAVRSEGEVSEQASSRIPAEAMKDGASVSTLPSERELVPVTGTLVSDEPGGLAQQTTESDAEPGTEPHHSAEPAGVEWNQDLLQLLPSEAQSQLGLEARELGREGARLARSAASVTSHMYKDAMALLSLFGLPYLTAPTEAEAQCAVLDTLGLTQGTITDDNDVFLFGGKRVYRHFFTPERHVELYSAEEVERRLGLSRDHLVTLAYLLGSDYSEGVEGVGVVSAMEILRDFPGKEIEPLKKFKAWHGEVNSTPALSMKETSQQRKLRQLLLPPQFPDPSIQAAYLAPEVDPSQEPFQWGRPDLDLIRKFALDRMGWPQSKVDATLLPVLRRMNARETQLTLTRLLPQAPPPSQKKAIKSKRIRNAVARLTGTSTGDTGDGSSRKSAAARSLGRRRGRGRGRGRGGASAVKRKRAELSSSGSSSEAETGLTGKARSAAGSGNTSKGAAAPSALSSSGSSSEETGKTSVIKKVVSDHDAEKGRRGAEVISSESDSEFDSIVRELVTKEVEFPGFQEVQSTPTEVQQQPKKRRRI